MTTYRSLAAAASLLAAVLPWAALAGQLTPLSMQMDRTPLVNGQPAVICANRSASQPGCDAIGTMSPQGAYLPPVDTYRFKKAINANAQTAAAGGADAMVAYALANASPQSNQAQAATTNIPAPSGGDFETLALLPWLQAPAAAGGLGLSPSGAATLLATLRASASALPL